MGAMSHFHYVAVDPNGRERRGAVQAASAEEARGKLDRRRLYVVRLEASGDSSPSAPLLSRGLLSRRRIGAKELTVFTRQLATLVQVSPLEESLRTMARQAEREHLRRVLGNVHAGVVEGRRLSEAMAREPLSFPALYRGMVAAGEASGTLPAILERLALLLERQGIVRGKILSALACPWVLALVSAFA